VGYIKKYEEAIKQPEKVEKEVKEVIETKELKVEVKTKGRPKKNG